MGLLTKEGFIRVGIPWGFNEFTDIDGYFSERIYTSINVVDFIPIIPKINTDVYKDIKDEFKLASLLSALYKPDPELGCKYYNSLLKKFNLSKGCCEVKGVRLYITDQTQLAETINNSYDTNIMHRGIEKIQQATRTAAQVRQALKGAYAPPDLLNLLSDLENNKMKNVLRTIDSLLSGLRIDYPVVWQNTEYNRRITLNVNLSTPYGHPDAVWVWIVMPMLFLILLGTPVNWGGPIGYPLYVSVRSHGLFYIRLGAIESITIDRGGQNTTYNVYRQPLNVNLNVTIRDLYSSLSVDPEVTIDAKSIITTPQTSTEQSLGCQSVTIYTGNTSMPTVDKLVRSFAPELNDNKRLAYKTRVKYSNYPPEKIALNNEESKILESLSAQDEQTQVTMTSKNIQEKIDNIVEGDITV